MTITPQASSTVTPHRTTVLGLGAHEWATGYSPVDSSPAFGTAPASQGDLWLYGDTIVVPICVHVDASSRGSVAVISSATGIFGSGEALSEAIMDFRAALVEHREFLEAAGPLSADLMEQLTFLRQHLRAA